MSMPNIPSHMSTDININHKDLIDLLLISIALEELSLAHMVNAEGELMQTFIKQLNCVKHFNREDIIKVNRSISDTLRLILEKEQALKEKLRYVIQFYEDSCN